MASKKIIKLNIADLAIFISVFITVLITLNEAYWREEAKIIESDTVNYYVYLPSVFIYQDLSLKYAESTPNDVKDKVWYQTTPEGSRVVKMTMGVAYFYTPFFILCHHMAPYLGYAQTGFTMPYRIAVILSALFYLFVGLYFVKKIIKSYYNDHVAFWTILIIGAGTNIVNYTTREPGMSHVYSFATIAAFLYCIDRWYLTSKNKYLYIFSFLFGLILLIRPTNALLFIIILLYGVGGLKQFKERASFLWKKWKSILIACLLFFIPIIPQMFYWKYNTGHWIFYSYTSNEGFFFDDPKVIDGLFSYKKGWLVYTPLMFLSIIGLFVPRQKIKNYQLSSILFLLALLYVSFSWWCWYYGGSYGMRIMIDHYALFSIPIAGCIYFVTNRKNVFVRVALYAVIVFFIYLNQFQSYQYRTGSLHYADMNKKTYWMRFLNYDPPTMEYYNSLTPSDPEAEKLGIR